MGVDDVQGDRTACQFVRVDGVLCAYAKGIRLSHPQDRTISAQYVPREPEAL